ncbi:MAG: MucB/RseB, partial [Gammaproteobacteria bacterium]|nr:MucB/RseB [Gammaproteobacteria bacterium]
VTCILPDARSVVVEKSRPRKPFPGALLEDTRELAAHYELMLLGSDRIADRPARLIGVKPKDSYRYGYRLWLDEQTAMPLKIDLMSEAGEALEQVMFTRLELPEEIPVAALEPAISGEGFTWYRGREMEEGPGTGTRRPSRWTVTRLPPGFKLIEQGGYRLPGSRSPVEHMVFSDMLASVSVYIESQADEERFEGHSRMGAVNAFGTTVDGHPVTVVGEVPEATVTLIGRSVVHRAQGAGR